MCVVFFCLMLFVIGAGLSLESCTAQQQELTLAGSETVQFHKPRNFYPKATRLVNYWADSLHNREYFYFLDQSSNTLLYTAVDGGKRLAGTHELQQVSLRHLFYHTSYPIEAMGIFSLDSLIFVDGGAHAICLTDAHGTIRQQWQPRTPIYGRMPYFIDTALQPVYVHGSYLYLHCGPDSIGVISADSSTFHKFLTYNTGLVLNVRDTTFANNKTGQFPSFLSAKNSFNIVFPQACVSPTGDYIFTYGPFSELYRYSLNGDKQVLNAPSRYYRPARGLPFAKLSDRQALTDYKITEPEYGPLISDPFRHRYLRVYRHGLPAALDQPLRPSYADLPWSLLILNSDLQVVGEVKFASTYDPRLILATRRGILIGNRRPENTNYNPQQLSFQLFTYQLIKKTPL